jgi:DNA-binding transcriptional ArsR family regulator
LANVQLSPELLASLEEGGLVSTEKVGRVRTVTIEPKALRPAERWIAQRREGWERRLDRLEELLQDIQRKIHTLGEQQASRDD